MQITIHTLNNNIKTLTTMGFIKEFKEFAMKGNVMDMAQ